MRIKSRPRRHPSYAMAAQVIGSIPVPVNSPESPLTIVMRRPLRIRHRRINTDDIDEVIRQLEFDEEVSPIKTPVRVEPATPAYVCRRSPKRLDYR